jgi:dolichol kinase
MRVIAASVLSFEAIIVVLAIPVAITLGDVDPTVAGVVGGALALACIVVAGMLRRPWGYAAGWVVQVLILLSGFVVHAMFFVGGLFVALWWIGLRVGRQGEELRAERWARVDDPRSVPPDAAG